MWRTEQRRVAGRPLAWRRAGAGPPVLYLHDAGAETLTAPALDELAADCEVVAPWLPGYGLSGQLEPDAAPETMGAVVTALMAELGWPTATVAGTSLGGWFALEAALAAPERVSALVLCDPAGLHVPEDHLMRLFAEGHAAEDTPRLRAAMAAALPADERDAAQLPAALAAAVHGPFVQRLAAAASCGWHPALANPRLLWRLPRVRCPATILWGGHDPLVPLAHGRAMAEALPQARLEVLDDAGHLPPLDAPRRVAAAVRQARAASTGAGQPAATLGGNPTMSRSHQAAWSC